jgi:hypothetical protein
MSKYDIVRFHFNQPNEVIKSGVSLDEAQAHCQRDDTHGDGWFDGYRESQQYMWHPSGDIPVKRNVGILERGFQILAAERTGKNPQDY